MSTKKTTTASQAGVFDPGAMQQYQSLTGAGGQALSDEIRNPYGNMFFNQQLGMQRRQIGQGFQQGQQALQQRAQAMGINPSSPAYFSQLNKLQRQMQSEQSQGYNQLLLGASNIRQGAISQAMNFRPLQTGQHGVQTEQSSGLGTWLPQVAGMGLSLATGGMSGMGAGGGMGAFGPQMSQMAHMGQGFDPSGWSGQGQNSSMQPTSYSAPTTLQSPW